MKEQNTGKFLYRTRKVTKNVMNMNFIDKHELSYTSEPFEWFNAFIPFKKSRQEAQRDGGFTIGNWVTYTKLKANLSNAGMFASISYFTEIKYH